MTSKIEVWKIEPGSCESKQINVTKEPLGSLDEATRLLPAGGYTTLRTYHGNQALRLDNHYHRLVETARLSGILIPQDMLERSWQCARHGLRDAVSQYSCGEKRIRIILDLSQVPGTMYFLLEDLTTPSPEMYEIGVKTITRKMQRQNPKAKLTNFVEKAASVRLEIPPGVNEVLMISEEGQLLEGLSSNFFGVMHDEVYTAEAGVLNGITRETVINVIQGLGIPLHFEPVHENEAAGLSEAFLTSASRAVLPVTQIDGQPVGSSMPGDLTRKIQTAYQAEIEFLLEMI